MSAPGGKARRKGRSGDLALLVGLGFMLSACASSGPQFGEQQRSGYHRGQPSYKVGSAYQINGKWYYPKVNYGYDETGLASWYGEAHRGRLMANGRKFNPDKMTAASWFYPLGTRVRVTVSSPNFEPRSVTVTVTDRGPAKRLVEKGRVIDLGRAAFQKIAHPDLGLVSVVVEPVQ